MKYGIMSQIGLDFIVHRLHEALYDCLVDILPLLLHLGNTLFTHRRTRPEA